MAHFESVALGGYYPTPPEILTSLASLVRWEPDADGYRSTHYTLFDPVAGDGAALVGFRDLWWPELSTPEGRNQARAWNSKSRQEVHPCEMEATRAAALNEALDPRFNDEVFHADAFTLSWRNHEEVTLLYWFELDYSAPTYRQANGRLHRIGQENEVDIYFPYWEATPQETALQLIAQKVTTSLQVDGLDLQGALEAAGADEGDRAAAESVMALGEAIYARLIGT